MFLYTLSTSALNIAPTTLGSLPAPDSVGLFKVTPRPFLTVVLLSFAISLRVLPLNLLDNNSAFFLLSKIGLTLFVALAADNNPFSVLAVKKATIWLPSKSKRLKSPALVSLPKAQEIICLWFPKPGTFSSKTFKPTTGLVT